MLTSRGRQSRRNFVWVEVALRSHSQRSCFGGWVKVRRRLSIGVEWRRVGWWAWQCTRRRGRSSRRKCGDRVPSWQRRWAIGNMREVQPHGALNGAVVHRWLWLGQVRGHADRRPAVGGRHVHCSRGIPIACCSGGYYLVFAQGSRDALEPHNLQSNEIAG